MLPLASHDYIFADAILEEGLNTSTFVDLKYFHVYNFGRLEISSLNEVVVWIMRRQHCLICFKVCFILILRFDVTFLSEKLQLNIWVAALYMVLNRKQTAFLFFIWDIRHGFVYVYTRQRPLLTYWQLIFSLKFHPRCLIVLNYSRTLFPSRTLVVVSSKDSSLLIHLSNC